MAADSFEVTIQYAQAAIRGAFLLNGGSCIALLAFIRKSEIIEFCKTNECSCYLSNSLTFFAFGALAAVITSALSYLSQGFEYQEKDKQFKIFRNIAISVYILSLILFVSGIYSANTTFSNFGI